MNCYLGTALSADFLTDEPSHLCRSHLFAAFCHNVNRPVPIRQDLLHGSFHGF